MDFNSKCIPCQKVSLKQESYQMQESLLPSVTSHKIATDTPTLPGTSPFFMMYDRNPISQINTWLQTRQK